MIYYNQYSFLSNEIIVRNMQIQSYMAIWIQHLWENRRLLSKKIHSNQ